MSTPVIVKTPVWKHNYQHTIMFILCFQHNGQGPLPVLDSNVLMNTRRRKEGECVQSVFIVMSCNFC